MSIKHIFFDMDGTIIDSSSGLMSSFEYMFQKINRPAPPRSELKKYLGPVIIWSLEHYYHLEPELIKPAREFYYEHYTKIGVHDYKIYDGVKDMKARLSGAGKRMYIATAKDCEMAEIEMKEQHMFEYFEGIFGAVYEKQIFKKEQVLELAMKEHNIIGTECVMVGDRGTDIIGGKEHGMTTVAVLYGFGEREELEETHPDYTVETVEQLEKLLAGLVE